MSLAKKTDATPADMMFFASMDIADMHESDTKNIRCFHGSDKRLVARAWQIVNFYFDMRSKWEKEEALTD